jgi:hypothetical protein
VNDLRMRLVDLETRSHKGGKVEGSFLAKRIQEVQPSNAMANDSSNENYKIESEKSRNNLGQIAL